MSLPQVNNSNVQNFLNKEEIVVETANQIIKDFGLFGVEITFSGNTLTAYNELHQQLVEQIIYLTERKSDLLYSILYQVDITDKQIARAELELPHYTHIEIIAHQIIVRDLQKVLLRRYFKAKGV